MNDETMEIHPFSILASVDMLAKAQRELDRLRTELNAHTIFNFFVTAYHVMDYVKAESTVSKSAIDAMYKDPDFELAQFICNRGKHLVVKKTPKQEEHYAVGAMGSRPMCSGPMAGGPSWIFLCDGEVVDHLVLAEQVMQKWKKFFKDNGISY
jgi:hypothetical protein